MSGRRIPDRSCLLKATRCPPASNTATVRGFNFNVCACSSAASTMRAALSRDSWLITSAPGRFGCAARKRQARCENALIQMFRETPVTGVIAFTYAHDVADSHLQSDFRDRRLECIVCEHALEPCLLRSDGANEKIRP